MNTKTEIVEPAVSGRIFSVTLVRDITPFVGPHIEPPTEQGNSVESNVIRVSWCVPYGNYPTPEMYLCLPAPQHHTPDKFCWDVML